jgi:hypothetical protein
MSQSDEDGPDIFRLVSNAIFNVLGDKRTNRRNSDAVMGDGFFDKIWTLQDDDDLEGFDCVTTHEVALLEHFAGPHGYVIWKAWKAQKEETND